MVINNMIKLNIVLLILSALLIFLALGCGNVVDDSRTPIKVVGESSCTVQQLENSAVLSCPDGSSAVINNGKNGIDGKDGIDGQSCEIEDTSNGAIISCENGSVIIHDGKNGKVRTINPEPIYEGYFCSRTVVRIGKERYVINSGLVLLSSDWYSIGSCKIRYYNKQIQVDY